MIALDEYEIMLRNLPSEEARRVDEQRKLFREEKLREERQAFYNQPSADLDAATISYWSMAAVWQVEEALALALGKSPGAVTPERMAPVRGFGPFKIRYLRTKGLLERAIAAGELTDPLKPLPFIEWAKKRDLWASDELATRTAAIHSSENACKEAVLDPRERTPVHKLIIGMAIACYKHDPKAPRTRTAKAITTDLLQVGISIDEDTVHSWLKASADVLTE